MTVRFWWQSQELFTRQLDYLPEIGEAVMVDTEEVKRTFLVVERNFSFRNIPSREDMPTQEADTVDIYLATT